MHVKEIMSSDPCCCTTDAKISDVARMMVDHNCGAIPVVDSKDQRTPVGVITDRDIVCRAIAQGRGLDGLAAGDLMSTPAVTISPEADIEDCEDLMCEHQIRRVLVTDNRGTLHGIIAQADIARHCREEETAHLLQDVSA